MYPCVQASVITKGSHFKNSYEVFGRCWGYTRSSHFKGSFAGVLGLGYCLGLGVGMFRDLIQTGFGGLKPNLLGCY